MDCGKALHTSSIGMVTVSVSMFSGDEKAVTSFKRREGVEGLQK